MTARPVPFPPKSPKASRRPSIPQDPLWRHRAFLTLWAGQTVSLVGSQITPIALPLLAVLTLQATPGQMALLRAISFSPPILLGLVIGAWVDRLRRRPLMIGADLGRALLLLTLPVAAALGLLQLDLIFAVAFLLGSLDLVFGAAYGAFLPVVVPDDQLIAANSRLASSAAVSAVAGPGLAGVLVQWFGAPLALLGDAVSFLVSAGSLALVRTPEPTPPAREQRQPLRREIAEGLRVLRDNRILFAFVASSATLDVFWNALRAVYFLFLTRSLGLPVGAFGLIFGVGSVGSLAASVVAHRLPRRLGLGRTLIAAQYGTGAGGFLIALAVWLPAYALPLLIAAELVQSFSSTVYSVGRAGVQQAITPPLLRGRVDAAGRVFGFGAVVLGSLLGGLLGQRLGLPASMVIGACGSFPAFLWLLWSPLRTLQDMPV